MRPRYCLPSGVKSPGEKGSIMRINALAILFAVGLGVPPVGAQTVRQENTPLPQFMPPEARAHVVQKSAAMKPAADETRRAAEALSARFSGDLAASNVDTATDAVRPETMKPETTAPAAIDPQASSATPAHVAVLRAREPSTDSGATKSKIRDTPLKTVDASNPSKSKQTKAHAGRSRAPRRTPINSYENAQALASNAVPGAESGWKTGLIGMLTNPAFWH